jgi:MFS family permease
MGVRPAPSSLSSRLVVLRHRDFRLLWGAEAVSAVGSQMHAIAANWQVLQLLGTRVSHLSVGGAHLAVAAAPLGLSALGLVRVLPVIVLALVGGLLADTLDRRRVLMAAQATFALLSGVLAVLTLTGHIGLPALYALAAAASAVGAFAGPAEQALVPHLAPRAHLAQAYGLFALLWQVGTLAGPPLAGVALALAGPGAVYAVDAASFVGVALAARALSVRDRARVERQTLRWAALTEGVRVARRTPLIRDTLLIDLYATFFASARSMLPLVAVQFLHAGALGYGLLATAQPVGAALTGLALALRRDIRRQGRVLLISVAAFGAAWALFGLAAPVSFALAYAFYALTGVADTVSYVIRTTIRQLLTPDDARGRMAGLHLLLGSGGPELGELEAGLVASVAGIPAAIVAGGLVTVVLTAWVAQRRPALRAYTGPSGPTTGAA